MMMRLSPSPPSKGGTPPHAGDDSRGSAGTIFTTPLLIIEDESMIAWMLENILTDAGFTSIALASTGEQAEAFAAKQRPGLVISDINLGAGKDGIAAAQGIRGATRLPLIFVTAYADDGVKQRLADALPGAQILRKPVDEAALMRAVMRALGN